MSAATRGARPAWVSVAEPGVTRIVATVWPTGESSATSTAVALWLQVKAPLRVSGCPSVS